MARVEFKPPSDFTPENSGGGGRNVWKWLGIGCGVIVLITGLALAFGAWKTVSCCTEFAESGQQAAEFSKAFARDLANGNVDEARAKMSESLASRISREELATQIDEHSALLSNAQPRVVNTMLNQRGEGQVRWEMTVEFSPVSSDDKLALIIDVLSDGEGEDRVFEVDSLQFDRRTRDLQTEPPASAVVELHRQLAAGSYEQAYDAMGPQFAEQNSLDDFRAYVRAQPAVFRSGDVRVREVEYSGQREAYVRVEASAEGQRARIEYVVEQQSSHTAWKITSINPSFEEAAGAQEPADQGTGENGAGEADQDEAELGDTEPGDEEPSGQNQAPDQQQ